MAAKKDKVEAVIEQEVTPEAQAEPEVKQTMKVSVKYKTLSSGPEGTIYPGTVVEVTEEEAKELITGGYVDGV